MVGGRWEGERGSKLCYRECAGTHNNSDIINSIWVVLRPPGL